MPTRQGAKEQKDVLAKKGNVTETGRGLQIWGEQEAEDADPPPPA